MNSSFPLDYHLRTRVGLLTIALFVFAPWMPAEVHLPALFGDGMVLQRDGEIPVWGTAASGEKVVVELAGNKTSVTADAAGSWSVRLPKLPAGGPHTLVVSGSNKLTISDVLIGEVWFASGQSNMEWILKETDDAAAVIAAAIDSRVRVFRIQRAVTETPQTDVEGKWLVNSPKTAGWMTAVGYHFANTLAADLDVPVGVINSSRGASQIIPWIPRPVIEQSQVFSADLARWQASLAKFPAAQAAFEAKLTEWGAAKAKAAPGSPPRRPDLPYGPGHYNTPGGLYNGMVAPVTPYAIRGFIWYQGGADAKRAAIYREAFPLLINSWRQAWGRDDLPFLFVQEAAYRAPERGFPAEGLGRAELREAQTLALALPLTGMAITLDVSGPHSQEHPRNKRPVGERLARLAGNIAYGRDRVVDGPVYAAMKPDGGSARIAFQPGTAGGLAARDGGPVVGFFIAGADKVFHPAGARIEGETVRVSSTEVPAPVAVRYAFSNDPVCNLINAAGLPAAPFRTDHWSGVLSGSK